MPNVVAFVVAAATSMPLHARFHATMMLMMRHDAAAAAVLRDRDDILQIDDG